ncbi:MAG TPA: metallophosphoesterase, partial [Rhodothermales bacterium]|nr:metallophosphoesterase [Rhodothermales bacterium]
MSCRAFAKEGRRRCARTWSSLAGLTLLIGGCVSSPYLAESLSEWKAAAPPPEDDLLYRIYLIGDSGYPRLDGPDPILTWLEARFKAESENSAAVYLGDNIYPKGLPESDDPLYAESLARINKQLDALKDFRGRIVFIPGNHDWDKSGQSGLWALNRQEDHIEAYLNRGNTFLPDDGFPGPSVVELTEDLVLVAIDTEWWLHDFERPIGDTGDYNLEVEEDFLIEFDDVMREYEGKRVIVAAHHSMYSNGEHAGFMSLKHHLFPLTKF